MTEKEGKDKIKELADEEFLTKLLEIGKIYGWSGDYIEVFSFIEEIHDVSGKEIVDREPYNLE